MVTRFDSYLHLAVLLHYPINTSRKLDANRAELRGTIHPGASIRHRRGISKTRLYIYTPSAIQSPWAPSRPAGPRPAHVGSHSLRWDLIMLRHRRASTNTKFLSNVRWQ